VTVYTFRDAELRSRPLRIANGASRTLGWKGPSLHPDSIVAAAQKRAGSENLGSDSYREPLERYVAAVEDEAELSLFGRVAVRSMIVSALANRIELAEWTRLNPDASQEQVAAPWVIVGLPRTGTSLLSILLGLDPNARAPLHWEAAHLIPPPTLATSAEDPRITKTAKELGAMKKLNPAIAAMHPFGATIAQECVAFFMYDMRTLGMETQALVPSYGSWLQECDMGPAYEQHRLALQALQHGLPTDRWILKTPNHLWCLDSLFATYPDARVIWTHRDPGRVVTSLASLVNALQRTFTERRDPLPTAEDWKAKAAYAMTSGMAFDDGADTGWCQHVRFDDLMADPVAVVTSIYQQYDEAPSPLHVRRMQAWLAERGRDAEGSHRYDPADFGWTYENLADEFSSYRERYGV
jgi:hypothetical protein